MKEEFRMKVDSRDDFGMHPYLYCVKPFRIFGNLYFVGNVDAGSYLIDTGDGLVLIDTTYPETAAMLIESIWELGFDPRNVKYILHSHGHFDHYGATSLIVALSGAKTFIGEKDAVMFRERPELALDDQSRYVYSTPFVPDVALKDGDWVELGNTAIRAVATPGHTDGNMSFFFNVTDKARTLTAGAYGGVGLNTLTTDFIMQYGNTHSRGQYLESLKKVEQEKVDIILGNHTGQTDTLEKRRKMLKDPDGSNPFIDETAWGRFIMKTREAFYDMIEKEHI